MSNIHFGLPYEEAFLHIMHLHHIRNAFIPITPFVIGLANRRDYLDTIVDGCRAFETDG
jgi:hypothetical protein